MTYIKLSFVRIIAIEALLCMRMTTKKDKKRRQLVDSYLEDTTNDMPGLQSGMHVIPVGRQGKRCKCGEYTQWTLTYNVSKVASHLVTCSKVSAEDKAWLLDSSVSQLLHGGSVSAPAHAGHNSHRMLLFRD